MTKAHRYRGGTLRNCSCTFLRRGMRCCQGTVGNVDVDVDVVLPVVMVASSTASMAVVKEDGEDKGLFLPFREEIGLVGSIMILVTGRWSLVLTHIQNLLAFIVLWEPTGASCSLSSFLLILILQHHSHKPLIYHDRRRRMTRGTNRSIPLESTGSKESTTYR
jgi:hypothetical protein